MINAVSSIFTRCAEGRREKLKLWVSQADVEDAGFGSGRRDEGTARADWSFLTTEAEKSSPRECNNEAEQ